MKQQKSTLFDKRIPTFVETTNRPSNDLSVEALKYSTCSYGKSGMKFIEFTTKVSKFPKVFYFRQHSPNFGPFPKFSSIRNTIGSGLKRVATGSISKRYRTTFFFAQLSENSIRKRKCRPQDFDLRKMFRATSWVRTV